MAEFGNPTGVQLDPFTMPFVKIAGATPAQA
jgi:hypothetical protein